jgi:hypothetical protein
MCLVSTNVKNGIDNQRCVDCLRPYHQPLTMEAELVPELLDISISARPNAREGFPVQSSSESSQSCNVVWLNTVTLASIISFSDPV